MVLCAASLRTDFLKEFPMVRSSAGHVLDKSEWGHQFACVVPDKQPQGRLMRCGLVRRMVWNNVGRRHPLRSLAWAASRHRLMMGYAVREIQACAKTQTRGTSVLPWAVQGNQATTGGAQRWKRRDQHLKHIHRARALASSACTRRSWAGL